MAKLTGDDQHHPFIQASVMEVRDEGSDAAVEVLGPFFQGLEDMAVDRVVIPVVAGAAGLGPAQGHGDQVHAGLDKPAGDQALLAPCRPAIALAQRGRLLLQVQRPPGVGTGQDVQGLLLELAHQGRARGAGLAVELPQQTAGAASRPSVATSRPPAVPGLFGSPKMAKGAYLPPR